MTWWMILIVALPVAGMLFMGWYSGRFMKGVVDFLASGRACGRYMLTASLDAQSMSVLTVVGTVEVAYQTGMAMTLWNQIIIPITLLLSLTGFAYYRFRETRAMSLGQFLEMRYNKKVRIGGAALRTFADVLATSLGPAISARFFIYLLDLPHRIAICGVEVQTYSLMLIGILILALAIILFGGQLAVNVTDTCQTVVCYPILVGFAIYILCHFSWDTQVVQVLADRAPGESFINPFDVNNLRDFNAFALMVTVVGLFLNRANYIGGGIHGSARSPHEQKMSGVLATWRSVVFGLFAFLVGLMLITTMNHKDFATEAKSIRDTVSSRVADEILTSTEARQMVSAAVKALPEQRHEYGVDKPLSRKENLDTPALNTIRKSLETAESQNLLENDGNSGALFQEFQTLYFQASIPVMLRQALPPVLLALLCVIMILMMISTDDSRILYNSMTVVQDLILPFRKTPLTPEQHILLLRLVSVAVGVIFFINANVLAQIDYIFLFINMISALWIGCAGPLMLGGLYTRIGTAVGAYCALICGGGFAVLSALMQRFWASHIYPFLESRQWVDAVGNMFATLSAPLHPWIVWEMNPYKFPVNAIELSFAAMMIGWAAYFIGSLLSFRKPYNLEKMLHRGEYADPNEAPKPKNFWNGASILSRILSITPDYTRGDKIIAWAAVIWSLVYGFGVCFVMVLVWNTCFGQWSIERWGDWVKLTMVIIPSCLAAVIAVWFGIGAFFDLKRLFHDLRNRQELDANDDGRVFKDKDGEIQASK